jgi:predicted O-linked N-acetylglucosamine transferase (SPINDLY family)
MGAEFIDYIVADSIIIPAEQREYYSEKVIYLPHSYQPNDDNRTIAAINTQREDFGLPARGFVFCCFNNSYKISPDAYEIWMRLLQKVDGSCLWLLEFNKWAEQNLRMEAEQRGIDQSRLVFAKKLPHSEHLARLKHADLFLDTFNYNAHTTASDALWAGLPVVTKQGKQFAARVAASLLTAVGLPELITDTEEDYEALILSLATEPEKLSLINAKLAANPLLEPLFDTKRYTLNYERGLQKAYDLHFQGKQPEDIFVREIAGYTA